MIIGNGLIARTIQPADKSDVVLFASGVSNSVNAGAEEYIRESNLLLDAIRQGKTLYYFSTISIFDPDLENASYIRHKLNMEELIRANADNYLILRLPNIASLHGNPRNMIPFFHSALSANTTVSIQRRAKRYLIDPLMLLHAVLKIREEHAGKQIINLIPKNAFPVIDIYLSMAGILNLEPRYEWIEGGAEYHSELFKNRYLGPGSSELEMNLDTLLGRVLKELY